MDWQRLAPAGTRKQMAVTALAGLLLGLGGVTAGTGLVQASERGGLFDFFESIFRGPAPEPMAAPVRRRPAHYASLPDARRVTAARVTAVRVVRQTLRVRDQARLPRPLRHARARVPETPVAGFGDAVLGARTFCVRACDGYLFPVGRLAARADLPVHEAACAAACPNAPTSLFTLGAHETEMDRAVGLDGRPYRSLAVANLYRTKRVAQCACQPEGRAAIPLPLAQDRTLRAGDVVATAASAAIVTQARDGGFTVVDFREARGLSRQARRAIDAKVDVIRREADARAFRNAMRRADRASRIRLASGAGFQSAPPIEVEPAFAPARASAGPRVVMASPFVY
jgi:hypothetical protein